MPYLNPYTDPGSVRVVLSCRTGDHKREAGMFSLAEKYTRKAGFKVGSISSYYSGLVSEAMNEPDPDDNRYCVQLVTDRVFLQQLIGEARLIGLRVEEPT